MVTGGFVIREDELSTIQQEAEESAAGWVTRSPELTRRILVVDVETGGLDPDTCGLTEIAAVCLEHTESWSSFGIVGEFSTMIAPVFRLVYAPQALSIQGRTMEDLLRGDVPTEFSACSAVSDFVFDHFGGNLRTVAPWAHNAEFDLRFLMAAYLRTEISLPFNRSYRCTSQLFRFLGELGFHREYKSDLGTVCRTLGISSGNQHHALDDARAAALAAGRMMQILRHGDTNTGGAR